MLSPAGGVVVSAGGVVVSAGGVVVSAGGVAGGGAEVSGAVVVLDGVLSCLLSHAASNAVAAHRATRNFAFINAP